jgi:hypothetical protein
VINCGEIEDYVMIMDISLLFISQMMKDPDFAPAQFCMGGGIGVVTLIR